MMTHTVARFALGSIALLFVATHAPAQIKEPPRAEKLDIQIRYRIRADRDERVRQFRDLEKHLATLGFDDARKNDPDRDLDILDPNAERFSGTIPAAKVMQVLDNVRVQNILFAPNGFAYPDSGTKPVAIRIGLRTGNIPPVQQQLHKQLVAHLARLGFVEALAYDTRGYSLVRGRIPYQHLDLLVKDVRSEPSGWFATNTPLDQLPAPLRDRNPIRWTEVLPISEFIAPFAMPPVVPVQMKYSADLRAALLNPATKDAPIRVEVIFANRIESMTALKTMLESRFAGSSLDGVLGNIVSVRLPRTAYVDLFAQEPEILGVRLPRQASETVVVADGGKGIAPAEAIKAARLDALHKLGYTGTGMKVLLIGSDFTGAEKLIGSELPKNTKLVDLTTELASDLRPSKSDPTRLGTGIAAAKALAAAAPDSELILVRIDPGCAFQLHSIIRLARGELQYTEALQTRLGELVARGAALDSDRTAAIAAYRAAFADTSDNEPAIALRKKTKAALEAVFVREKELTALTHRFTEYQKEITTSLYGAHAIVNTLVWESGYPLDALSEISAIIEQYAVALPPQTVKRSPDPRAAPKPPLVWLQAASSAGAAVWGGPFLDANNDGVMEFIPPKSKLPTDNWSRGLNFLGTHTPSGEVTPNLAAGTKLRIVVQWREPADPNFPETDIPVHPLTLRLLRQLDPIGAQRSSDEMAEEARSVSVPNIIYRTRTFLVFEQMVEFTVPAAGRFALMLESPQMPEPQLPALRREVEIYPRIVVETLGTAAGSPKAVFRSYTTRAAGVGIPGDSHGAITIGIEASDSLTSGGIGLALRIKPDVFAPQSASGNGVATAFAGGAAALLLQTRASGPNVFLSAGIELGGKLVLPQSWLRFVPRAAKPKP